MLEHTTQQAQKRLCQLIRLKEEAEATLRQDQIVKDDDPFLVFGKTAKLDELSHG